MFLKKTIYLSTLCLGLKALQFFREIGTSWRFQRLPDNFKYFKASLFIKSGFLETKREQKFFSKENKETCKKTGSNYPKR